MKFILKLASKPGIPNKNGVIYSKDTFNRMINSEYTKRNIKNNCLMVTMGTEICKDVDSNDYKFYTPSEACLGTVSSWQGDQVEVDFFEKDCIELIQLLYDSNNLELGMNYTCRFDYIHDNIKEAKGMKIHDFTLYNKISGLPIGQNCK